MMEKWMRRVLAVVMAATLMMMGYPAIDVDKVAAYAGEAELPYTWYLEPSVEAEDVNVVSEKSYGRNYGGFIESYYCLFKNDSKCGIIDRHGNIIIESKYNYIGGDLQEHFILDSDVFCTKSEYLTVYGGNNCKKCGVLSTTYYGNSYCYDPENNKLAIIGGQHDSGDFSFQSQNSFGIVTEKETVIAQLATIYNESINYIDGITKNKYGVVKNNSILLDFVYDNATDYRHGVAALQMNGKWGYVNSHGEIIIPFEYDADFVYDVYDGELVPYLPSSGYIALNKNEKGGGYYDTEGNEIIPVGTFEEARPVHNGLAWVKDKETGLWGVIEISKGSCKDVTFSSYSSSASAAITENGEIYVWGEGAYENNGYAAAGRLSPCKLNFNQKAVAINKKYVLTDTGEVYYFDFDQLDPAPIQVLTNVNKLCENAAITNDGELYLFGSGYDGNGNVSYGDSDETTAKKVESLTNVISACNCGSFVAAVTEDGSLYTWGDNGGGQSYGNGHLGYISDNPNYSDYTQKELYPRKVNINGVEDAKFNHIGSDLYVLKKDGTLYECEYSTSSVTFNLIFDNIKSFECGASYHGGGSVLAISNEGSLFVSGTSIWGFGDGNDIYNWESNPLTQKELSHFGKVKKAITSGDNFAVVKEDGSLYTWGQNTYGVVGNGEKATYDSEGLGDPNSDDVFVAQKIFNGKENIDSTEPDSNSQDEQKLIKQLQNFIASEHYDTIWREDFYDASTEKQWMTLNRANEILNKSVVSNLCETFDEAGAIFGNSATHTGFDYLLAQMMVSESSYNGVEDMYKTNTWKSYKKILDVITKYSKQWVEDGMVSESELNQWRDYFQECIDNQDQEGLVKARNYLSAMASNNDFGEEFISAIESAGFIIKVYDKVAVSTVDEVMQYVVYGEAYLETCNEFTEVLYRIADYADYLNKDGATDNELYAVSSSIREFISDMQRYVSDNAAAIATEFAVTAVENCWSLAEDKLKTTILDGTAEFLDIAPLYKELKIGYKYLDKALNATVNLDNMEKYGQIIEGYEFLSKLLYGVTTDNSYSNAIQEQFTNNPAYENAALFQEATNMKKNMQLLAYDAAIDYFSSMADNYMNTVNRNDTLRWQNDKNISDLQLEKSIYGGISTNVNDTVYQDMLNKHLESLQNAQTVIVHCPVALQITDAEGNFVASLSQEKTERIEEYFYLCDTYGYDRDVKIAIVKENDQFYIKGMGYGTMSLEIIDNGLTYMFTDIPVTDTMDVQFEVSSSGDGILTRTDNLTTVTYKATIMGKVTHGDLNTDTHINASDAAMVLIAAARIGAGSDSGLTPEQETAADVNGDTKVNASDAAIILQYAAAHGAGDSETFEEFLIKNRFAS